MSIQTELTRITNAKAAIKTAIEGKGVTVPDGTMLDGMAALIEAIEAGGGIPIYTKNIVFAEDVKSAYTVNVSDILFTPNIKTWWFVIKTSESDSHGLSASVYIHNGGSKIYQISTGRTLTGSTALYTYGMIKTSNIGAYKLVLEFTGSNCFVAKAGSTYTIFGIKMWE